MELILNELYLLQGSTSYSEDFQAGIRTAIEIVKKYRDFDDNSVLQSLIENALIWWSTKTTEEKTEIGKDYIIPFEEFTDLDILELYKNKDDK